MYTHIFSSQINLKYLILPHAFKFTLDMSQIQSNSHLFVLIVRTMHSRFASWRHVIKTWDVRSIASRGFERANRIRRSLRSVLDAQPAFTIHSLSRHLASCQRARSWDTVTTKWSALDCTARFAQRHAHNNRRSNSRRVNLGRLLPRKQAREVQRELAA